MPGLDGAWWDDAEAAGTCVDAEIAPLVAALNAGGLVTHSSEADQVFGDYAGRGYVAFRSPASVDIARSWLSPRLAARTDATYEGDERGTVAEGFAGSALGLNTQDIPSLTRAVLSATRHARLELGVVPVVGDPLRMAWVGPRLLVRLYGPAEAVLRKTLLNTGLDDRLPAWVCRCLGSVGETAIYRVLAHYQLLTEQDELV